MASSIGSAVAMFSTFPKDARWNAERQAVEFGVETENTAGWFGSGGVSSNTYCQSDPPPSGASNPTTFTGPGSNS
jgi:hypothetical protein